MVLKVYWVRWLTFIIFIVPISPLDSDIVTRSSLAQFQDVNQRAFLDVTKLIKKTSYIQTSSENGSCSCLVLMAECLGNAELSVSVFIEAF